MNNLCCMLHDVSHVIKNKLLFLLYVSRNIKKKETQSNALYHTVDIRCSGVTLAHTWATAGALVLHMLALG